MNRCRREEDEKEGLQVLGERMMVAFYFLISSLIFTQIKMWFSLETCIGLYLILLFLLDRKNNYHYVHMICERGKQCLGAQHEGQRTTFWSQFCLSTEGSGG